MNIAEDNEFKDTWQKAFDDASIPPSEGVWNRIEGALPPNKKIPFWKSWRLPVAGIVGILLLIILMKEITEHVINPQGKSLSKTTNNKPNMMALTNKKSFESIDKPEIIDKKTQSIQQSSEKTAQVAREKSKGKAVNLSTINEKNTTSETILQKTQIQQATQKDIQQKEIVTSQNQQENNAITPAIGDINVSATRQITPKEEMLLNSFTKKQKSQRFGNQEIKSNENTILLENKTSEEKNFVALDFLKNNTWKLSLINITPKIPWVTSPILPQTKPLRREFWIGFSYQVGAFDSNLQNNFVTTNNVAYSAATMPTNKLSTQDLLNSTNNYETRSGSPSYQLQLKMGRQFTKHWYWESGVSFWQGNSILIDRSFIEYANGTRASSYVAKVSNQALDATATFGFSANASGIEMSNNFQFVSIPIKIGYVLKPEKKLSYIFSAGLSADMFLKNDIQVLNDQSITANANNTQTQIYKPLNTSLLLSTGIRWKTAQRWALIADLSFQKSIFGGIQGDNNLQIKPSMIGLNIGTRYYFHQ